MIRLRVVGFRRTKQGAMERTLIDFQPVRLTGNGHISNEGGYFSVPAEGKAYGFDIAEMDLGDYFDIVPVNREEE